MWVCVCARDDDVDAEEEDDEEEEEHGEGETGDGELPVFDRMRSKSYEEVLCNCAGLSTTTWLVMP